MLCYLDIYLKSYMTTNYPLETSTSSYIIVKIVRIFLLKRVYGLGRGSKFTDEKVKVLIALTLNYNDTFLMTTSKSSPIIVLFRGTMGDMAATLRKISPIPLLYPLSFRCKHMPLYSCSD